jgi:hypothetical protein
MRKKRKYRYQKREFLNSDIDLRAYIIASVRESEPDDHYSGIELEIADCNRHISLDFDFHNKAQSINKAEKKIKLFRKIINDFADAVEAEIAAMRLRPRKKTKLPKIAYEIPADLVGGE